MIRPLLHRTAQLGQGNHWNLKLSCKRLQGTGDVGNLLLPGFVSSPTSRHELEVVDDDHFQIHFQLELTALGTHFRNADARRIIDDELGLTDHAGTLDQLLPLQVGQVSGS